MMERKFFLLASVSGGLAVVLGAFGAHILKVRVDPQFLTTFEIGVRYQIYHALALLALASVRWPSPRLLAATGWLFLSGTILFSGSLYLLTITGKPWFGAITPLGGLALIIGWLCLALAAWRR